MTTPLHVTDTDLFILSAALQVLHNTGPEFGRDAFIEHESLFAEDATQEMENYLVDLANRIGETLREKYPTPDSVNYMPDDMKRHVIFGMHVVAGSEKFRDLTLHILEQIVEQREQMVRRGNARNN